MNWKSAWSAIWSAKWFGGSNVPVDPIEPPPIVPPIDENRGGWDLSPPMDDSLNATRLKQQRQVMVFLETFLNTQL